MVTRKSPDFRTESMGGTTLMHRSHPLPQTANPIPAGPRDLQGRVPLASACLSQATLTLVPWKMGSLPGRPSSSTLIPEAGPTLLMGKPLFHAGVRSGQCRRRKQNVKFAANFGSISFLIPCRQGKREGGTGPWCR